jgi:hypothetical protein
MGRQYSIRPRGTLSLAVHLYIHFQSFNSFYGHHGPYVFASMTTSELLAAAPPSQSAIAETPLKADPRTSGGGQESYTIPYNTCRTH